MLILGTTEMQRYAGTLQGGVQLLLLPFNGAAAKKGWGIQNEHDLILLPATFLFNSSEEWPAEDLQGGLESLLLPGALQPLQHGLQLARALLDATPQVGCPRRHAWQCRVRAFSCSRHKHGVERFGNLYTVPMLCKRVYPAFW